MEMKNQEYEALKQIREIIASLGENSPIAAAFRRAFGDLLPTHEEAPGAVDVILPEQLVRQWEDDGRREALLRQMDEVTAQVTALRNSLYKYLFKV